jgi:NTP pyrophosphatase (non-canonical NTP hydrolase)
MSDSIRLTTGLRLNPAVQDLVRDFHNKFGFPAPDQFAKRSRARMWSRLNWIFEECDELNRAIADEDYVEICDALADILYFVYGFAVEIGVELDPIIAEVHRTNMLKEGGMTRLDGKLTKPPDWCPPDIASILAAQGVTIDQYGSPRDNKPTTATSSCCNAEGGQCNAHGDSQEREGQDVCSVQP